MWSLLQLIAWNEFFVHVLNQIAMLFQEFCFTTHEMKSGLCFSAIILLSYGWGVMGQSFRPPPPEDPVKYNCENIAQIEFCSQIGYSMASFPNYRDQTTQTYASGELENFRALAQSVCSNAVVHFLCSVYAPFCDPERPDIRVPPCRELCEYVRVGCEPPVIQFGLSWPPHLKCNQYPPNASTITYCPSDISMLSVPSNIETYSPLTTTEPTEPATTIPTTTDHDIITMPMTAIHDQVATTVCSRSPHLSLSIFFYFVSLYLTLFLPCINHILYTYIT